MCNVLLGHLVELLAPSSSYLPRHATQGEGGRPGGAERQGSAMRKVGMKGRPLHARLVTAKLLHVKMPFARWVMGDF